MKHVLLGVLLGLLAAFPQLAGQGAAPVETAARWLLSLPAVWAFCAGAVFGPRIVRRLPWRIP